MGEHRKPDSGSYLTDIYGWIVANKGKIIGVAAGLTAAAAVIWPEFPAVAIMAALHALFGM